MSLQEKEDEENFREKGKLGNRMPMGELKI